MKTRKGCLIILCFLLMCSALNLANGKTIYVDDDGGKDYINIEEALNASTDGDTIYVYSGTYYENLLINTTIHLIGEDKNNTIIDGNNSGTVIAINADKVNITGFTVKNSGLFTSGSVSGIGILTDFNYISGNIISNNCNGISIGNAYRGPWLNPSYFSLDSYDSGYNVIVDNEITNNSLGIVLAGSSNNQISENSITKSYNYTGKEFEGKEGRDILSGDESNGIALYFDSSNNTIIKNNISGHKYGILIPTNLSLNNTIHKNIIKNNNCGVYLFGDSSDNIISDNTYFDNIENIYYETTNQEKSERGTPGFELILVLIAVILVLFWQRKRI